MKTQRTYAIIIIELGIYNVITLCVNQPALISSPVFKADA